MKHRGKPSPWIVLSNTLVEIEIKYRFHSLLKKHLQQLLYPVCSQNGFSKSSYWHVDNTWLSIYHLPRRRWLVIIVGWIRPTRPWVAPWQPDNLIFFAAFSSAWSLWPPCNTYNHSRDFRFFFSIGPHAWQRREVYSGGTKNRGTPANLALLWSVCLTDKRTNRKIGNAAFLKP